MNKLLILSVVMLFATLSVASAYNGAYYYGRPNAVNNGVRYAYGNSYIPRTTSYVNYYGSSYTRFGPEYRGGYFGVSSYSYRPVGYQGGAFYGSQYGRTYYPRSSAQYYGGCRSDYYYDGYYTVPSRYCVA